MLMKNAQTLALCFYCGEVQIFKNFELRCWLSPSIQHHRAMYSSEKLPTAQIWRCCEHEKDTFYLLQT